MKLKYLLERRQEVLDEASEAIDKILYELAQDKNLVGLYRLLAVDYINFGDDNVDFEFSDDVEILTLFKAAQKDGRAFPKVVTSTITQIVEADYIYKAEVLLEQQFGKNPITVIDFEVYGDDVDSDELFNILKSNSLGKQVSEGENIEEAVTEFFDNTLEDPITNWLNDFSDIIEEACSEYIAINNNEYDY